MNGVNVKRSDDNDAARIEERRCHRIRAPSPLSVNGLRGVGENREEREINDSSEGHTQTHTHAATKRRAMEDLSEMDCTVLKRLLKDDSAKCLVLDCRSFLAFSAGHIRGAVNARCNTIVRRRAKGSVLSLDQILAGDEDVRGRLRCGMYSAVVLYDERTQDSEAVKEDSILTLVLNALCRDSSGTNMYLLKGK